MTWAARMYGNFANTVLIGRSASWKAKQRMAEALRVITNQCDPIPYFFLPDPKFGCQPADAPFWLGAAAMVLIFSFLGFFVSRLLLAMTVSLCLS
jgi:hypothetical protein